MSLPIDYTVNWLHDVVTFRCNKIADSLRGIGQITDHIRSHNQPDYANGILCLPGRVLSKDSRPVMIPRREWAVIQDEIRNYKWPQDSGAKEAVMLMDGPKLAAVLETMKIKDVGNEPVTLIPPYDSVERLDVTAFNALLSRLQVRCNLASGPCSETDLLDGLTLKQLRPVVIRIGRCS